MSTKINAEFSIHAIAGMPSAMNSPRKADLPREDVNPGSEGAKCQQGSDCHTSRVGTEDPLNVWQKEQIHHDHERQPMQRLRQYQLPLCMIVGCLVPAGNDANKSDHRREELPIDENRLLRKLV